MKRLPAHDASIYRRVPTSTYGLPTALEAVGGKSVSHTLRMPVLTPILSRCVCSGFLPGHVLVVFRFFRSPICSITSVIRRRLVHLDPGCTVPYS
jgi:hypothetical protein